MSVLRVGLGLCIVNGVDVDSLMEFPLLKFVQRRGIIQVYTSRLSTRLMELMELYESSIHNLRLKFFEQKPCQV